MTYEQLLLESVRPLTLLPVEEVQRELKRLRRDPEAAEFLDKEVPARCVDPLRLRMAGHGPAILRKANAQAAADAQTN